MTDSIRTWLIAVLNKDQLPPLAASVWSALIEQSASEGVLLLLEQTLTAHPQAAEVPDTVREALRMAAQAALFDQLAMLAEQQKVFEALQNADVEYLVLKGGALAHWLYAKPHLRLVTDLDILLPAQDALAPLADALQDNGYALAPAAGDRVGKEHPLLKAGGPYGQYTVDAHWALLNSPILADCFGFDELMADSLLLPGCAGARALSPVHALCNAAGHRALNLPYTYVSGIQNAHSLRWLWDIHLLTVVLTPADWRRLDALVRTKGLCGVLADALAAAVAELHSPVPDALLADWQRIGRSERVRMAWFASWPRFQWQQFLASDPKWSGRFRWLLQRIWPDPEAMRGRYGNKDPAWKFMFRRIGVGLRRLFG